MTKTTKQTRASARAARLHQEALNCLTIAVKQEAHSADLIDEALKLERRSQELNEEGLTQGLLTRRSPPASD